MNVRLRVGADFHRRPLHDRLREWAKALGEQHGVSGQLICDLDEAATELELGLLTPLTYLGSETR